MIGAITAGLFGSPPPPVTVTGGTLYTSGGYNYRVFTGNGTLGVSAGTLSCDILVVAGGGGAACNSGSGGGAGGLLGFTSQSLVSANYTVTIGGGGVGSNDSSLIDTRGTGSTFQGFRNC